jgi:NADH:ubiquinone oxidoreductase subunit E
MDIHIRMPKKVHTPTTIRVCVNEYQEDGNACCGARGGQQMRALLEQGIAECGIEIELRALECLGLWQRGPSIMLDPGSSYFLHAQPEDMPEILDLVEKFVAEVRGIRES